MSDKRKNEGRRDFLKSALLGGSAAAVAVASGGVMAAEPASGPAAPAEAKPEGYRETAHVREYYKKAQF